MRKYYFLLLIPLFFIPYFVLSQGMVNIIYPVRELGGCEDEESCRNYCDKFENLEQCYNFSRDNSLITNCQLTGASKILNALNMGLKPLPCGGFEACQEYCSDENNFNQCIDFMEGTSLITRKESLLLKKTKGIGPGGCGSKEECRTYCEHENHLDECLSFALEHGFFTPQQVARAIKVRDLADRGGPGGCKGLKQCAEYCSGTDNLEQCIEFGRENGFIGEEEIKEVEEFVQEGGPGECRTREECVDYCDDPAHDQECFRFMLDNNFMTRENIEAVERQIEESRKIFEEQLYQLDEEEKEKIMEQFEEQIRLYREAINNYEGNGF